MQIRYTAMENPKEEGMYLGLNVLICEDGHKIVHASAYSYEPVLWENGWGNLVPEYWTELPTVEEVEGARYVTE